MSLEPRAPTRFVSVAVADLRPYGASSDGSPAIRTSVTEHTATNAGGGSAGVAGVAAEITGVLTGELDRYHDEWRRMFATLHETLSPLSRLCKTASQREHPQHFPAVSALVDRLTAAAASETEAATKQAHAAAEMKVADAQAALGRLESELQSARATLQARGEELERERAAWADAQAAWEKARRDDQQAASAWCAQLHGVEAELQTTRAEFALVAQQLETERAERVKLAAALDAVQRALRFAEHHHVSPPGSGDALEPDSPVVAARASDDAPADEQTVPPSPQTRTLALVHPPRPLEAEGDPELTEYARELLTSAEAAYRADLESSLSPVLTVDRLTEHLRGARDRFVSRANSPSRDGSPLFKRHLLALLDSRWDTSFGRHLGIAVYQLYPSPGEPASQTRASLPHSPSPQICNASGRP